MFDDVYVSKRRMLRPVRRCKSGCSIVRVAPALV
jgi:hypothetical protein